MKNEHGFTLIEAIISLAILSVIIIGFTSAFSQGYFLIGEGRDLTEETFEYQEKMEMNMVNTKNQFIEDTAVSADTEVTVFQGSDYYETDIPLMSITENIRGNRAFQAYVSNVEIGKPEPPQVDLVVGVYADDNWVNEVFPWFDDNINLRATYTIAADPPVFSNTARWYQSNDGNRNPYFPSGFRVVSEETQEEPEGNYTATLSGADLIESYFYQFEISPYTFAGRLGQFTHEERIPVIERAGSSYWQKFIEDIYFGQTTTFNSSTYKDFLLHADHPTYTDVLLHADHPTLNVDWKSNNDPGGSLIGMVVPDDYQQRLPFESTISFEVDEEALAKDLPEHGLGVSLINASNTGLMATLDIRENTLRLSNINNGSYTSTIETYNLLTESRFSDFVVNDGVVANVDWKTITGLTYKIYNRYDEKAKKTIGPFLSVQLNGLSGSSDAIEIPYNSSIPPQYIGFKAYSSEDYYPDQTEEIIGKYDRNFAAHIKDVQFKEQVPEFSNDLLWVLKGNSIISSNELLGKGKSILIDTTINQSWMNNNTHLKVTDIFVDGSVIFNRGSEQLGHAEEPGNLVIKENFIDSGRRMIYGDLYIGADFSSKSTSTTYNQNVYVQGDANIGDVPKFKGDLFVNGNLTISGSAQFEGDVFVNGDLIITAGGAPTIPDGKNVYYHGELTHNYQPNTSFLNHLIKGPSLPVPKQSIPVITTPQPKPNNWYLDNGYLISQNTGVASNLKVVTNSGFVSPQWFGSAENVIIVALNDDIIINNFGRLTGILYAPNGKVEISGGEFEGVVIASEGFSDKQGGGFVKVLDLDEILSDPMDVPFILD